MSEGAPAVTSSVVSEYSNSKPRMVNPVPTATPLATRFAGDVVTPMNAVASADAAAGINAQKHRASAASANARGCVMPP